MPAQRPSQLPPCPGPPPNRPLPALPKRAGFGSWALPGTGTETAVRFPT
ncbi:hypothetical protein BFJ70_g6619 [Fusarium oxysporum]|uniref:Uncharacterized protein n=1 Tax=Fusarium oxysporum TaxID=5507 RepID=A0A420QAK4_FUSOX|nr:hypothetical protein BFJ67_g16065 [Fusarium oxysporum f. sp. cepae]RKK30654.1 hypothetical protein BFJ66_g16208 [Fusarium oxysporum f. sp. cepae]RKL01795.1 hypothetical protein BFJ68_g12173 [Fusarium oxysporum]RKL38326.1 hypothetical protein BFJ70_g6619 [Fusarium oxysporum]